MRWLSVDVEDVLRLVVVQLLERGQRRRSGQRREAAKNVSSYAVLV